MCAVRHTLVQSRLAESSSRTTSIPGVSHLNYSPSENDFAFHQFRVDLISSGLKFKVWFWPTVRVKGLGRIVRAVKEIGVKPPGEWPTQYSPSENHLAFHQFRVDSISSGLKLKVGP